MRGQQKCNLDFKTGHRKRCITIKQASAGHGGIKPARDDAALYDTTLGVALDRMAVTFVGLPFHDDTITLQIMGQKLQT
jgi:hypothetical protein